jgi:hypothetical protein
MLRHPYISSAASNSSVAKMHFTLLLHLLLITTVSSTSFFSSPSHNHDASQHPLEGIANLPPNPYARPFFSPRYGRCPFRLQWCCFLFGGKVHCGCCPDRITPNHGSDTVSLSYTDITARALAEVQNVTTLEVYAEIQPGNNETLARLFELSCDKGRQHVACTQTVCGFACGCYDNWDPTDIGKDKYRDEIGNAEAATRKVLEHKYREEVLESEDSDKESSRQGKHSDFSFQSYRFPLYIVPGTQHKCSCFTTCTESCICQEGPNGFYWYVENINLLFRVARVRII